MGPTHDPRGSPGRGSGLGLAVPFQERGGGTPPTSAALPACPDFGSLCLTPPPRVSLSPGGGWWIPRFLSSEGKKSVERPHRGSKPQGCLFSTAKGRCAPEPEEPLSPAEAVAALGDLASSPRLSLSH